MKRLKNTVSKIGVTSIVITLLLCGCNQKKQDQQFQPQQMSSQEEEDKVPKQLKSLESSIEKIIKTLEGPAVETEEEDQGTGEKNTEKMNTQNKDQGKEEEKGQSKDTGSGKEEGEGGEKDKSEGSGESSGQQKEEEEGSKGKNGGQEQQAQVQKPKDPWQEITPVINTLHYQWNSYMPLAAKKNANKNLMDSFGNALNNLTNTILTKDKTNTLLAASGAYTYIPDFYTLYKTETSPEIKRIRHYTRNAMLNSMIANWTQAEGDITNLKSTWSLYKNIVPKEQQEDANKLDYSIYELEKVITARNQPLTDIKGRVSIANIQGLEKAMEDSSKKGSQKSESQ